MIHNQVYEYTAISLENIDFSASLSVKTLYSPLL